MKTIPNDLSALIGKKVMRGGKIRVITGVLKCTGCANRDICLTWPKVFNSTSVNGKGRYYICLATENSEMGTALEEVEEKHEVERWAIEEDTNAIYKERT